MFQGTRLFNRDLTIKIRNGGPAAASSNGNVQPRQQQNPFSNPPPQRYHAQILTPAKATALISGFNNITHSCNSMGSVKHRERTQQPLAGTTADINALLLMGNQFMQPGISGQANQTESKTSSRSDNRSSHRDRPYSNQRRNRSPDYRQHDNRGNSRHHDRNSGGHGGRRR